MGEIRPGCKGARDEIRPTKKLAALSGAHRADDAPLLGAIRETHPADGPPVISDVAAVNIGQCKKNLMEKKAIR